MISKSCVSESTDTVSQFSKALMTDIVDEVERLSPDYGDRGMYQSACDLLSSMGYTTVESDVNYLPILQAYRYAESGDYKSAILYGLTKIVIPGRIKQKARLRRAF